MGFSLSSLTRFAAETFTTYSDSGAGTMGDSGDTVGFTIFYVLYMLFIFTISALLMACMWKIFVKAGRQGWEALVPGYNMYVQVEIIDKPVWWFVMNFVPIVNIPFAIMIYYELAKKFGKGAWFTVLMVVFPFIAFPMLAFGSAQFQRSGAYAQTVLPPAPGMTPPTPGV
jgi:small-conductance mechanosensitive channel